MLNGWTKVFIVLCVGCEDIQRILSYWFKAVAFGIFFFIGVIILISVSPLNASKFFLLSLLVFLSLSLWYCLSMLRFDLRNSNVILSLICMSYLRVLLVLCLSAVWYLDYLIDFSIFCGKYFLSNFVDWLYFDKTKQ